MKTGGREDDWEFSDRASIYKAAFNFRNYNLDCIIKSFKVQY